MEQHKIDTFFSDFSRKIDFWSLDPHLSRVVISEMHNYLDSRASNNLALKSILDYLPNELIIHSINEENDFGAIHSAILSTTKDEEQVFLIWHLDSRVDICTIKTLNRYWDYIWYGPSDETLVLFVPNKFIIHICDWGEVRYSTFSK